jgi:hypothetical protein
MIRTWRKFWSLNMHKPENQDLHPDREQIDIDAGFEQSDVKITGIIVFLASLGIFVAVTGVLCFGIGKVINARMNREDGPNTKWTQTVNIRQLGNMPNSPDMQNKVAELAQQFPTPRVQTDDGNQDVADLHARENLLLDNYTWVDSEHTRVRIPVERAMELVAKNGIQVAPVVQLAAPMMGDERPEVHAPLTSGFAPTAFEQEEARSAAAEARQREESK